MRGRECVAVVTVRANSVGYLPDRAKRATVLGAASEFDVKTEDGEVVFSGDLPPAKESSETGELLTVADFSELTTPGRYYVEVPGAGRSPVFEIGDNVFREPLEALMLGIYGQRCGTEVSFEFKGNHFHHGECHMKDASLQHATNESTIKPATGGWHDAGDYGKYTVNGGFAVAMLLKAWEHFRDKLEGVEFQMPERGGEVPDILDEAKFQVDWVLTMQFDDGSAAHKVSGLDFEGMGVSPEGDGAPRYFSKQSTAAAAHVVAVAAQAARIFEEYDPDYAAKCLEAAQKSWAYLEANPDSVQAPQGSFGLMQYNTNDPDDRLWALAELWETTGEPALLAKLEEALSERNVRMNWDWPDVENLGFYTYALSRHASQEDGDPRNPDVLAEVEASLIASGDQVVNNAVNHEYGRGIGGMYYWGINGVIARVTMNLQVAHRLTGDDKYLDAGVQQLDHLLGRNYYSRSQVTGVGYDPPRAPHHRPSVADRVSAPWPGLLVGGSNQDPEAPDDNPYASATSWRDASDDYRTNEVAINWSTAMIYALAGFQP